MINTSFRKAQRQKAKASIMIEGLSGAGKTGLALILGYALANNNWEKVYHIDTENQSADLFVGIPSSLGVKFDEFNKVDLTKTDGYKPTHYTALRDVAINDGAEVVIMDSITHAWTRQGGVLDRVDELKEKGAKLPWSDRDVVIEKNEIFELPRDHRCHVITTVRIKEKFGVAQGDDGKTTIKSLGEQQQQQEGLKYEPDLVLRMVSPGTIDGKPPIAQVIKSRYAILKANPDDPISYEFTPELINDLVKYLSEGADPEEILAQQKAEIVNKLNEILKSDKVKQAVYKNIKATLKIDEATKLADIDIQKLKKIFIELTE